MNKIEYKDSMKKKDYLKPTMTVVPFKFKAPLLVGASGLTDGGEGSGEEDDFGDLFG